MRHAHARYTSTTFGERNLAVITVTADHREIQPIWHRGGWLPELFIGVCDGRRWGGNPREACVNRLDVPAGMLQSMAEADRVPRWWITDHFSCAQQFAELHNGDAVESADPRFPFVYRKLALLSSEWGKYAGPALRGATLFEVESRHKG